VEGVGTPPGCIAAGMSTQRSIRFKGHHVHLSTYSPPQREFFSFFGTTPFFLEPTSFLAVSIMVYFSAFFVASLAAILSVSGHPLSARQDKPFSLQNGLGAQQQKYAVARLLTWQVLTGSRQ
jgi:hypothetical protein